MKPPLPPPPASLWVKICGVRDVETALRIAELGADAIGINFYAGSPRCVLDVATAASIVEALPADVEAVGVFVNHTARQIHEKCSATGLTTVQLHGDEPDSLIDAVSDLKVIRAIRLSNDVAAQTQQLLADYSRQETKPAAWLVEAHMAGMYGGTGRTLDWAQLAPQQRAGWPRLILAGGLTPQNAAAAVAIVRPDGVDVASGVESSPGVKDPLLVARFLAACRGGGTGSLRR